VISESWPGEAMSHPRLSHAALEGASRGTAGPGTPPGADRNTTRLAAGPGSMKSPARQFSGHSLPAEPVDSVTRTP
jgi:hypothetical protein